MTQRYWVETRWGGSEDEPSVERLREILAELDVPDEEHPDTWMGDDADNLLTADESGLMCWERAGAKARHMRAVPRDRMLALWMLLSEGRLDEIDREAWQPGNGVDPMTPEERVRYEAKLAAALLEHDRAFYDSLGPERADVPCRHAGCTRGSIRVSGFCRRHHFTMMTNRRCPFEA